MNQDDSNKPCFKLERWKITEFIAKEADHLQGKAVSKKQELKKDLRVLFGKAHTSSQGDRINQFLCVQGKEVI